MSDLTVRFGDGLHGLRKAKGMTQEQLAEASDLSRNYVNDVERGREECHDRHCRSPRRALGVKMAELMPD